MYMYFKTHVFLLRGTQGTFLSRLFRIRMQNLEVIKTFKHLRLPKCMSARHSRDRRAAPRPAAHGFAPNTKICKDLCKIHLDFRKLESKRINFEKNNGIWFTLCIGKPSPRLRREWESEEEKEEFLAVLEFVLDTRFAAKCLSLAFVREQIGACGE